MKKNIAMRVAALVLMCTIVTSCFVSSTFAKYTSSVSGTATATVAKWSIKVNNGEIAAENPTVTFGLFDTIKEADTTSTESNVTAGKIAPGTGGQFNLVVKNDSEVDATYSIALAVTANDSNVPLEFSTDGSTWKSAASIGDLNLTGDMNIGAEAATKTVYWRWIYDGDDSADTALGIAAQTTAPTVTVSATITATQVD